MKSARPSKSIEVVDAIVECTAVSPNATAPQYMNIQIPDGPEIMKITTNCCLGEGAFGTVLGGDMVFDGETIPCAVKCSRNKVRGKELARLREEVRIMKMMKHPNIVRFMHAGVCKDYVYIVMERCVKKTLQDLLKAYVPTLPDVLFLGYQIIDAIAYIHSHDCIHRDLKPSNFVFDGYGNLKITDFGLSSKVSNEADSPRRTIAGTFTFMAPELMAQAINIKSHRHMSAGFKYSTEVDVWSVGVVLFQLMTRTSPYWNEIKKGDRKNRDEVLQRAAAGAKWEWPTDFRFDEACMRLVESMLQKDGSKRPTIEEVLAKPLWKHRPKECPTAILRALELFDCKAETDNHTRLEELARTKMVDARQEFYELMASQQKEMKTRVGILKDWAKKMTEMRDTYQKEKGALESTASRRRVSLPVATNSTQRQTPLLGLTASPGETAEMSGRYSFRLSTLEWNGICDSRSRTVEGRASAGRLSVGTGPRASLGKSKSPSKAGSDRPSVWLEGPPMKWEGAVAQFDAAEKIVRCPKKHKMELLTKFPDRSETGINDYGWGFWCDSCHSEIAKLTAKNNLFYHCKCGYDLCKACGSKLGSICMSAVTTNSRATTAEGTLMVRGTEFREEETADVFNPLSAGSPSTPTYGKSLSERRERITAELTAVARGTTASPTQGPLVLPTRSGRKPSVPSATARAQKTDDTGRPTFEPFATDQTPPSRAGGRLSSGLSKAPKSHQSYIPSLPPLPSTPSILADTPPPQVPTPTQQKPSGTRLSSSSPYRPSHAVKQKLSDPHTAFAPEAVPRVRETASPVRATTNTFGRVTQASSPLQSVFTPSSPVERKRLRDDSSLQLSGGLFPPGVINPVPPVPVAQNYPEDMGQLHGWVQQYHIESQQDRIVILYYCQRNCFGALVLSPGKGSSSLVHDRSRRKLYYIPHLNQKEARSRMNSHPYVDTHYSDSIAVLDEGDAAKHGIDDLVRLLHDFSVSLQLPPDSAPSLSRVAYVRKFFFDFSDSDPEWYMFRLSNGRSQISHPRESTQVRWICTQMGVDDLSPMVPKFRILSGHVPEPFADDSYFDSIRRSLEKFEGEE